MLYLTHAGSREGERPIFQALGRFVYRFRWPLIVTWLVIFFLGLAFGSQVSKHLKVGGFGGRATEATRALDVLQKELGSGVSTFTIVFSSDSLTVDDPAYIEAEEKAVADLRKMPEVVSVDTLASTGNPLLVSADRRTTYATVSLDLESDEAQRRFGEFEEAVHPTQLKTLFTGSAPVYRDIQEVSERDLRRAEMYTFPLALAALLIIFGTLVAAGLPIIMGGVSVAATLGLLFLLAQRVDMSIFVMNMSTMLGLGIAIDYSLFIVSRFREELSRGDVERATVVTVATAGKAVFFSGATVFVGLSGLLTFESTMMRSLGIGGSLVVAMSVAAALTLLGPVLAVLGPKVNALSLFRRGTENGVYWRNLANWVMRHPVLVFVPTLVFLLVLGTPFLRIRFGEPDATILPQDVASRQGYDLLKEKFGEGEIAPFLVVLTSENSVFQPANISALYDFTHEIAKDPAVTRVNSLVDLRPGVTKEQYQLLYSNPNLIPDPTLAKLLPQMTNGKTTIVRIVGKFSPTSEEAGALLKRLREADLEPNFQKMVGGLTAGTSDITDDLYKDFPRVIVFVVLVTYLVLLVLFQSVVLPLKAVLMNSLSILAAYGALVFVFQDGNFENLLAFKADGIIEASLPILLFCVLFGLSMDYEVFLLTRIKEVYDQTGDNALSVAQGLQHTGRIITSAALVIVVVTGSFALTDIIIVKSMGVGIATAILLDATIVRALLVPATMRLLGNVNWWAPAPIKRLLGAPVMTREPVAVLEDQGD